MSAATASDAATPMAKHGTPNGHWRRQRPVSHEDARRQKLIDEGSKLLKKARHAPKTTIDDQIWAAKAENLKLRLEFEFACKEQALAIAGNGVDGPAQPTRAASPSSIDVCAMHNHSLTTRARLCDVRDDTRQEASALIFASSEFVSRHTQTELTENSLNERGLLGGLYPPLRATVSLILCAAIAAALYTYFFFPEVPPRDRGDSSSRKGRTYS